MEKKIKDYFDLHLKLVSDSKILSKEIDNAITTIVECLESGNKLVLFGNGGSAADAQHIAAELIGRFKKERKSIPALSLNTDSSILTSLANDYSFDIVFSRQCESIVNKNDVSFGISTSGNSKNVLLGLKKSKEKGAKTIALLGNNGGSIKEIVDISIIVPSDSTALIQEIHRIIYHIICEHVEEIFSLNSK
jgi:D-sedoheptulose 7-phosphate isomerase